MSDPYVTRQEPTEDSLISNGDPDMALHYVDRLDAGIDSASKEEVIDALRFWVGEADYYKNTRECDSCFALAAGQCIIENGLLGDEHGHQYCDVERRLSVLVERLERLVDSYGPEDGQIRRDLQQIIDEHKEG